MKENLPLILKVIEGVVYRSALCPHREHHNAYPQFSVVYRPYIYKVVSDGLIRRDAHFLLEFLSEKERSAHETVALRTIREVWSTKRVTEVEEYALIIAVGTSYL